MPNVLFAAGFFALGIVVSSLLPWCAPWLSLCAISASLGILAASRHSLNRYSKLAATRTALIAVCLFNIGAHRYTSFNSNLAFAEGRLAAQSYNSIRARIGHYRSNGAFYTRIGIRIDSLCSSNSITGVSSCTVGYGEAVLAVSDSQVAGRLLPGTQIAYSGMANPLPRKRNPASFDYGQYLRRQNFAAEFRLGRTESVQILNDATSMPRQITRVRRHIRTKIAQHIPSPNAQAVMVALMLGDRSGIDKSIQEDFRNTGLMHLLAVSGLHVLIVGYSIYRLLGGVILRTGITWALAERIRAIVTLLVLVLYFLVAGQSLSILRALIMAAVFLSQHILKRRAIVLNSLGLAALVVLMLNPSDLYSIGFQLSFGAVASLVLLNPLPKDFIIPRRYSWLIPRRLRGMCLAVIRSIASSFAATVGTMPILVYHFGFVSFAGIVLNVAAIPITASSLSSGLLSVLSSTMGLRLLAGWLGSFADFSATTLITLTGFGNDLFERFGFSMFLPEILITGGCGALLAFYVARQRHGLRWKLVNAVGLVTVLVYLVQTLAPRPTVDFIFLDVGQGDSIVILTPEGRTMLVDTGPPPFRRGATGELIRAVLNERDRSSVDLLVHSHPHSDHIGGSFDVIEQVRVKRIVDNGVKPESVSFVAYDSLANATSIQRDVLEVGAVINLSTSTRVEFISPSPFLQKSTNLNEGSIVIRVVYGNTCALLTGDIESEAEAYLIRTYRHRMDCAIVKIPHHGSKTSSSPGFVARAIPNFATSDESFFSVVSVARKNRFGLPDLEALTRWMQQGSSPLSTADGAVWLKSDGQTVWQYDWRNSH